MKSKSLLLPVVIILLTFGGLYCGLSGLGTRSKPTTQSESNAPLTPSRSTASADFPTPTTAGEIFSKNQEIAESEVTDSGVRQNRVGSADAQNAQPGTTKCATDRKDRHIADSSTEQEVNPEGKQLPKPVGIRLASDVRLPVAAMPNDLKLNPIRQNALQHIIDEYYQTVAAAVSTSENEGSAGNTLVEENGEETRVITNSPAVEAARLRADWRFKAMFGEAAYMRMTMNTLLESRLPQNPTEH